MKAGDRVVLYTDGILEQKNDDGKEYGADRLRTILKAGAKLEYAAFHSQIFGDWTSFAGIGNYGDDITFLTAEFTG